MPRLKLEIGNPYRNVDADQLRDGVAERLINGYRDELGTFVKFGGLTSYVDLGSDAIDSLYETVDGTVLAVSGTSVYRINNDSTSTTFTGTLTTSGNPCYWAEDGSFVYMANGGKIVRIDLANTTIADLGDQTPSNVTHLVWARGYLLCNGDQYLNLAQLGENKVISKILNTATAREFLCIAYGSSGAGVDGEVDIYKSIDNGITWSFKARLANGDIGRDMIDLGSDILLVNSINRAGTSSWVYRSTDAGETWTLVHTVGTTGMRRFALLANGDVLITRTDGSFDRSTDNGLTFGSNTAVGAATDLFAIAEVSANTLVAATASAGALVYRSTNNGTTWPSSVTLGAHGRSTEIVAISSTVVVAEAETSAATGTIEMYRSTDGGVTFPTSVVLGTSQALKSGNLEFSNSRLLIGHATSNDDGGIVSESTDQGVTWTTENDRVGVSGRAVAVTTVDSTTLLVGLAAVGADPPKGEIWRFGGEGSGKPGDVLFSDDKANDYSSPVSWEFFNAEQTPDDVTAIWTNQQEVFTAGTHSVEVSWNSGVATGPWAYLPSAYIPYGILAPHSIASCLIEFEGITQPSHYYLGRVEGVPRVITVINRQPRPISTPYDLVIAGLTSATTAMGFCIQKDNKPFYVLSFQADSLTLLYNIQQNSWSELAFWNGSSNEHHLINAYAYSRLQNRYFWGDRRANGIVYTFSGLTDGGTLRRLELLTGNISHGTNNRKSCKALYLKGRPGQTITLDNRSDGATSFSDSRTVIWGAGETFAEVRSLGHYRQRQWRIVHNETGNDFFLDQVEEDFEVLRS